MKELTTKQKAFVNELPQNQWNGTKAAIAAGYSEKSAGVMACRLLRNPKIAGEIAKLKQRYQKELEQQTDINVKEIVKRLNRIYHEAIEKSRYAAANRAVELLGKTIAAFKDVQLGEEPEPIEAERKAEIARQAEELSRWLVLKLQRKEAENG